MPNKVADFLYPLREVCKYLSEDYKEIYKKAIPPKSTEENPVSSLLSVCLLYFFFSIFAQRRLLPNDFIMPPAESYYPAVPTKKAPKKKKLPASDVPVAGTSSSSGRRDRPSGGHRDTTEKPVASTSASAHSRSQPIQQPPINTLPARSQSFSPPPNLSRTSSAPQPSGRRRQVPEVVVPTPASLGLSSHASRQRPRSPSPPPSRSPSPPAKPSKRKVEEVEAPQQGRSYNLRQPTRQPVVDSASEGESEVRLLL